jgi:LysR family transcriptional regulator, glycine cleavage system transcriptional activator
MRLTEQGEAVLEVARKLFKELQMLEDRISPRDRPFRIRIFVSLAVRWLLPRLTDFYSEHPDLSLSIETSSTELLQPSDDCDACILYLPEAPTVVASEPPQFLALFEEVLVPLCAPRAFYNKPLPRSFTELAHHTLIHGSTAQREWSIWLKANKVEAVVNCKHMIFNLHDLAMNAAARGLGITMADQTLAQESIDRGRLVVPFGKPLRTGGVYVLWLQNEGVLHPDRERILRWFDRQNAGIQR